jgi:hypothetical protein
MGVALESGYFEPAQVRLAYLVLSNVGLSPLFVVVLRFLPAGPAFLPHFEVHVGVEDRSQVWDARFFAKNAVLLAMSCKEIQAPQKNVECKTLYLSVLACNVGVPPLQRYSRMRHSRI